MSAIALSCFKHVGDRAVNKVTVNGVASEYQRSFVCFIVGAVVLAKTETQCCNTALDVVRADSSASALQCNLDS